MSFFHLSSMIVVLTIVACVSAAPLTHIANPYRDSGSSNPMDPIGEPELQIYNPRYDSGVRRSEGTSLDSLSGATFGHSKRFYRNTDRNARTLQERLFQMFNARNSPVPKRNFDEIDRTNFDSFVKKNNNEVRNEDRGSAKGSNFDEIDLGFGGIIFTGR